MKALCIRMNGDSYFFEYEEGNEEELLVAMLAKAEEPGTPFSRQDIVDIVEQYPEIFADAA